MSSPIKKFSAGAIQVAIWENETVLAEGSSSYNTISITRRYKAKDGEWKSSSSLRLNDIPKAILALQEAYKYLALKEPETSAREVDAVTVEALG